MSLVPKVDTYPPCWCPFKTTGARHWLHNFTCYILCYHDQAMIYHYQFIYLSYSLSSWSSGNGLFLDFSLYFFIIHLHNNLIQKSKCTTSVHYLYSIIRYGVIRSITIVILLLFFYTHNSVVGSSSGGQMILSWGGGWGWFFNMHYY
jgi:hypothetical protein